MEVLGGWEKELDHLHESKLPIPGLPWELPSTRKIWGDMGAPAKRIVRAVDTPVGCGCAM